MHYVFSVKHNVSALYILDTYNEFKNKFKEKKLLI